MFEVMYKGQVVTVYSTQGLKEILFLVHDCDSWVWVKASETLPLPKYNFLNN